MRGYSSFTRSNSVCQRLAKHSFLCAVKSITTIGRDGLVLCYAVLARQNRVEGKSSAIYSYSLTLYWYDAQVQRHIYASRDALRPLITAITAILRHLYQQTSISGGIYHVYHPVRHAADRLITRCFISPSNYRKQQQASRARPCGRLLTHQSMVRLYDP